MELLTICILDILICFIVVFSCDFEEIKGFYLVKHIFLKTLSAVMGGK